MNMQICKTFLVGCVAVAVVLCSSMTGHASRSLTYLTFDQPFALPGITLAKGTYVFERAGVSEDLVRVKSRDGKVVYLTALTSEVQRPADMSMQNQVTFREAPAGTPRPISAWFPEGVSTGRGFMYQ